jgi:hypothetical protein
LHPAVLDACFQITAYRPFHGDFAPNNYYLPSRIGEIILHQPPKAGYFPPHVYGYVELTGWMPGANLDFNLFIYGLNIFPADSIHFNVTVVDDLGKRLVTLRNFEVAKHQITPNRKIASPLHIVLQPAFHGLKKTEPLDYLSQSDKTELYTLLDHWTLNQVSIEKNPARPHAQVSNFENGLV